jgi:predicted porin
MKKELLMGTALVSTLGAASVAEAVTATMSGNHQVGVEFDSPTGGTDTNAQKNDNNFTVSLSETTDGGMTISSSFKIMDEGATSGAVSGDMDAGLTFAFTDGSKLDVINAGNASGTHAVSIPSSAGAEGVATTSTNSASTGLDFMTNSTALGVEYHTAADFLADGLKMSFSASTDDGTAATATYKTDSHYAIGATYVTDLGDTALTIGGGYQQADGSTTGSDPSSGDTGGVHIGLSAVTGDLTVAIGFADGDTTGGDANDEEVSGEVVKAGLKYVTGDLTFNVGLAQGTAKDNTMGTAGTTEDSKDVTSASVSYVVAAGVTAILGYTDVDSSDEGSNDTTDGSSWYIGANMAF